MLKIDEAVAKAARERLDKAKGKAKPLPKMDVEIESEDDMESEDKTEGKPGHLADLFEALACLLKD